MRVRKSRAAAILLLCQVTISAAQPPADAQDVRDSDGDAANPAVVQPVANVQIDDGRNTATPTETAVLPTIPVSPSRGEPPETLASDQRETQDTQHLEEVVVTATKRAAAVRELPESVAALDGGDLEKRGVQGIDDIARLVPGVNVATENGISRITIRGIAASNNTNATTGTLFGNVSFTDSYIPVLSLDPQPFDLKSVEVLKGPQGTLFGASALNGAVRYVPEEPVLGEFSARYFGQYTGIDYGGRGPAYGAAVNIPVGEEVAARVVAFNRNAPGYIDNLRLNEPNSNYFNQWGARGIVTWRPDDLWKVNITFASQNTDVNDNNLVDNLNGQLSSDNRPRNSWRDTYYRLADADIERSFDWAQLISETAFVRKNLAGFLENTRNVLASGATPLLGFDLGGGSKSYTQEFRLVSTNEPESRWSWITGVFGSRQDILDLGDLQAGNGTPLSLVNTSILNSVDPGLGDLVNAKGNVSALDLNASVRVTEIAAFADVTRKLGDSWEVSLGARAYQTRSGGTNTETGALIPALGGTTDPGTTDLVKSGGVEEKSINPKASVVWHVNPNIYSYAAISKGFRVGGLQPGATLVTSSTQAPPVFKSDTIWNYEGGVRTTWFDRTLYVDTVPFYIVWKNPQTLQYDSTTNINYLDNVGGVKSEGVDFSLKWLTPYHLQISTSATWTETVTTAAFQTGSGNVAPAGTRWPFSPRWQTATTVMYPAELEDWLLTPAITHTYLGKTINDLSYQKPIFNYEQLDALIGLQNTAIAWLPELNVTVSNVLNVRGLTSNILQGQVTDASYSQPRTLIIRLSGSF